MKRMGTSLCVAVAFGCIASLGAQTTTASTATGQRAPMADKAREVSMTGCLSKGADGKYILTNARIDPMHGSSLTTTAGTSTTTAGTTTGTTAGTTTVTTTSTAGATASDAMSWMLAGGSDLDLDKHVGHKIQVTGRSNWDSSMDKGRTPDTTTSAAGTTAGTVGTSGTTTTAAAEERKDMRADQPRLDVQSLKMIAPSCS